MITGMDSVFLAQLPVSVAMERFLDRWLERWPGLRVASGDEGADGVFSPWVPGAVKLPADAVHLLVARDEQMEAGWDDFGYVLDERGEGPFSLACEPVGWRSLRLTAQEDPYGRTGFRYEPYDIAVVGAGLQLVTVVTPPESDWSRTVLETLVNSFVPATPGH
ncbi:hypothetical protein OG883_38340 [Streptomyces sp. NBC_01142]|uniref:hypothetical protein n=1 Tax=Streptomyces sp. NBC_01142 TaxID=2975865 RepID=UPI0022551909|nr:hypothetical protein [Streptomyces sp. NBC_01142]MCX4825613.1 hypothetical protein [Streptomyces sp. NBC_01142]